MSKTLERRARQREALVDAAEKAIRTRGLAGLKTRELAQEIGVANGAVYNLVADVDELVLLVGSRTLARLDADLSAADAGSASPDAALVRIALAYCAFAAANLELWRALFEHRMAPEKPLPDWAVSEQMHLFRHIHQPLALLFPDRAADEISITARSLFSAVHGMVALGLEQRLVAVPLALLRQQITTMVKAMVTGLVASAG